jgi:hypothetical protein
MKKLFILIAAAVTTAPLLALAQINASDTINLPPSFMDNVWAEAQNLWTSFSPVIESIIGVILALLVIGELVHMLRKPTA